VDAGVGATGADEFDFAFEDGFEGGAEFAHDGAGVALFCPTAIFAAVVLDREAETLIELGF
jgi:hypothetical protein